MKGDISEGVSGRVRAILMSLARDEDERAADEAAATPYWSACPASVAGHRAAAAVLRGEADSLLAVGPGSATRRPEDEPGQAVTRKRMPDLGRSGAVRRQ